MASLLLQRVTTSRYTGVLVGRFERVFFKSSGQWQVASSQQLSTSIPPTQKPKIRSVYDLVALVALDGLDGLFLDSTRGSAVWRERRAPNGSTPGYFRPRAYGTRAFCKQQLAQYQAISPPHEIVSTGDSRHRLVGN